MIDWVLFQATVPETAMPELTRLVANLTAREVSKSSRPPEATQDRVARALDKIGSIDGRTMVRKLAELTLHNDGYWVSWPELHTAMGLDARTASGVLGALQRVLKGEEILERNTIGGVSQFRMTPAVAHAVTNWKS